jgi:predicted branched-subunit amino acid permease
MKRFWKGVQDAIPVMLGYIPIAMAYAAAAGNAGMTFWQSVSLSVFVYTGAGQMAAAGMIAAKASAAAIVVTVFIMNLRHIIMSTVVMNDLKEEPMWKRILLSFGVTDEVFAVFSVKHSHDALYFAGLALASWVSWWAGTMFGCFALNFLPDSLISALSITLYAMFLALLVPGLKQHAKLAGPVAVTAICSLILGQVMASSWALILSSLLGALAGLFMTSPEDV